MKFLLVHNHYQQSGGEDHVFADEAELLESHGHQVLRYTMHNDLIREAGRFEVGRRFLWNSRAHRELRKLIQLERPALMHCTNIFPLISPSAYYAGRAERIPVVQTLHNYRMLCLNALFMRSGRVCEDCLGARVAWKGVRHACYRDSYIASSVVAALQTVHRAVGTWTRVVDTYIALTEFARQKFIAGGLPEDKIVVKPNFITPDPGPGEGRGRFALFIGRLSQQKGVETVLSAWRRNPGGLRLKVVGDGPLAGMVEQAARQSKAVEWLGYQPRDQVHALLKEATVLLAPSISYEGALPRTVLEAFAAGTPVVASRLGSMSAEIVDGQTGYLFAPGDATELAGKVEQLLSDSDALLGIRRAARDEFELRYTASGNYRQLMTIYGDALRAKGNEEAAAACARECVFPHANSSPASLRLRALDSRCAS